MTSYSNWSNSYSTRRRGPLRSPRSVRGSEPIQAKLTIGETGDRYEQEADRVARKVVSQINSPESGQIQAKPAISLLQRLSQSNKTISHFAGGVQRQEASSDIESSINSAKGGGQSLDPGLQRSMGQAMGADFSGVKVYSMRSSCPQCDRFQPNPIS